MTLTFSLDKSQVRDEAPNMATDVVPGHGFSCPQVTVFDERRTMGA
jgi:hypothetical protein